MSKIIDGKKPCSKCGEVKPLAEFHRDRSRPDGRCGSCKVCNCAAAHRWAVCNRERARLTAKARYDRGDVPALTAAQRERKYARLRERRATDPAYRALRVKQSREYNKKNRKQINARKRERWANDPEFRAHTKALSAKSRAKDPERTRRLANQYMRERYHTDLQFRLAGNLRSGLNRSVKYKIEGGGAVRHLGCSVAELIVHLEAQFQPGMTWDNYGLRGWHIDHIRPLAKFDLTDLEQRKQAAYYMNLRPLWAFDNLSKGAKWDPEEAVA